MATTGINSDAINPSDWNSDAVVIYLPINAVVTSVPVEIFGETVVTSDRVVISASASLSAANLAAYMQYQENAANADDVDVVTYGTLASGAEAAVASDLNDLVKEPVNLDASYASWWADGAVKTVLNPTNYLSFTSLSEFLLSQIAYDVLGHPMAKAGVANDKAILAHFEDSANNGLSQQIVDAIDAAATLSDAAGAAVPGSGALRMVYQQLFKQAPGRFEVQDSTAGASGAAASASLPVQMPFVAGDKIRFEITLNNYNVVTFNTSANPTSAVAGGSDSQAGNNVGLSASAGANNGLQYTNYGKNTYTLEVTLSA